MSWASREAQLSGGTVPPVSLGYMNRFIPSSLAEEDLSMGHAFNGRGAGRWFREWLRGRTRQYRWENFPIHCAAQAVVGLMLAHYYILNGSLPEPIYLIGTLLFSILFWRVPTGSFRRNQLHVAAQSVLVCLGFVQEFLAVYLFMLLIGQAVLLFRIVPAAIWIGAYAAVSLWGALFHHAEAPLVPAVRAILVAVGFIFTAILSNRIAYERRVKQDIGGLLAEVSEAHARLREYVGQRRFLAVVEEHNRLARDLHNSLGHRLTVAIVQVDGASRLMERDPLQADTMLKTVHTELTAGLDELRDTIRALSTPEINADTLAPALRQYVSGFTRETGIALHMQLTEANDCLSESLCLTMYRAVQEGLTNMREHSAPENIWVNLDVAEETLILTMRHDGKEFDPSIDYGYGLPGMQERAFQLGGALDVTRPAQGEVLVTFSLPCGAAARAGAWSNGREAP